MSSVDIANTKIIILHLVSDTPGVTYHMLMDKCLDSLYMDFFTFSQGYDELIAANMLEKATDDSSDDILYITEGGKVILNDVKDALSNSLKQFLKKSEEELGQLVSARNRFKTSIREDGDVYYADLSINDTTGIVFTTSIRCNDKESCKKICDSWKNNAETVMNLVIKELDN